MNAAVEFLHILEPRHFVVGLDEGLQLGAQGTERCGEAFDEFLPQARLKFRVHIAHIHPFRRCCQRGLDDDGCACNALEKDE